MSKLRESKLVSMVATGVVAALGVAVITFAATTISTNVNTGGTLTVSGASTLNGAVTLGDAAGDAVVLTGNASTTNALTVGGNFYVGGNATTTSAGALTLGSGLGLGAANTVAKSLLFSPLTSDPTAAAGLVYYNSGSAVLRMSDGTNWFTVGTSTSGLTLSGSRLQLADLNYYMAFGTTTQQGLSILTVEATSTAAIPLTIVARNSQTAHLLNVRNSGSSDLLYIDSGGGLFGSSTLQISGVVTTYGNMTLGDAAADTITINASVGGHVITASTSVVGPLSVAGPLGATSTLTVDGTTLLNGAVTLGDAAGDNIILTGNASTTNSLKVGNVLYVGGYATTSGTTGNIQSAGSIVASSTSSTLQGIGVATSTPVAEFAASGSATTTLYLNTTSATKGSCIEMIAPAGSTYAVYVNNAGTLTAVAGSCK